MLPRNFLAAGPGLGFTRSSIEPVKVTFINDRLRAVAMEGNDATAREATDRECA